MAKRILNLCVFTKPLAAAGSPRSEMIDSSHRPKDTPDSCGFNRFVRQQLCFVKSNCSFQHHLPRRGRALCISSPYRRSSPVQSPKALAQRCFSLPAGACCCAFDCSVVEIDNDHGKKQQQFGGS